MLWAIMAIIVAVAGYFTFQRYQAKKQGKIEAEHSALKKEAKLSKEIMDDNKEIRKEAGKKKSNLHKGGLEALLNKKRGK